MSSCPSFHSFIPRVIHSFIPFNHSSCVMSGMLCLSVRAPQHLRNKYSRLFSGSGQTMQQFMWQSDIVGVVYVRDSLLVLLADGDGGDRSSNQP